MARRGDIDDLTLEQGDGADDSVVPASVMKVLVALTAAVQLESGQLDATARVRLPVVPRTPGPVGFRCTPTRSSSVSGTSLSRC